MKSAAIIVAVLFAGCSTLQSPRVLAPGKTRVSAGVSRVKPQNQQEAGWLGEVAVAHGVSSGAEIGVQISRTPGVAEAFTAVSVVPKLELSDTPTSAVSIAFPIGLSWSEEGLHGEDGAFHLLPTLCMGMDMSPQVEAMFTPRALVAKSSESNAGTLYGFGGAIGLRIGDKATQSALQPELGLMVIKSTSGDGSETIVTIGLSVSAGD